MDSGVLTTLLNTFAAVFSGGFSRIYPDAMHLLSILAALEVAVAAVWWTLTDENVPVALLRKIMQIGFFIFLVTNYETLINVTLDGFVLTGLKAGGAGAAKISLIKDPSAIIDYGFTAIQPIFTQINDFTPVQIMKNLPSIAMAEICALLVILAFFVLAIQVFITYLEFFLVSVLGLILIPFGVFKHTSFLAEKVFGAIVSFGMRLMVLAFILTITEPTLASLALPADPDIQKVLVLLLTALTVMALAWHAPAMAGGLMAGAPSLTAGTAVGTGMAMAMGAAGAGMAAKTAAGAIAGTAETKAAAGAMGSAPGGPSPGGASTGAPAGMPGGAPGGGASPRGSSLGSDFGGSVSSSTGPQNGPVKSSIPEWAYKMSLARQAIPQDAHPGPGMSVPLRHDS